MVNLLQVTWLALTPPSCHLSLEAFAWLSPPCGPLWPGPVSVLGAWRSSLGGSLLFPVAPVRPGEKPRQHWVCTAGAPCDFGGIWGEGGIASSGSQESARTCSEPPKAQIQKMTFLQKIHLCLPCMLVCEDLLSL